MQKVGIAGAIATLAAGLLVTTPATAQFYMKSKDLRGERVRGDEPGIGQILPGATADELRAAMVWNLRAALNVAALQCQFEPSLLTVQNYNAILADHKQELAQSYAVLAKYFERSAKSKKEGQNALDQFGTRTYSGFATVAAQFGFCTTAADIGRAALYAPRGGFGDVAMGRMRELRNSLTPWGEQQFPRLRVLPATLPRFDKDCWKKSDFDVRRCGEPLTPITYAAR